MSIRKPPLTARRPLSKATSWGGAGGEPVAVVEPFGVGARPPWLDVAGDEEPAACPLVHREAEAAEHVAVPMVVEGVAGEAVLPDPGRGDQEPLSQVLVQVGRSAAQRSADGSMAASTSAVASSSWPRSSRVLLGCSSARKSGRACSVTPLSRAAPRDCPVKRRQPPGSPSSRAATSISYLALFGAAVQVCHLGQDAAVGRNRRASREPAPPRGARCCPRTCGG